MGGPRGPHVVGKVGRWVVVGMGAAGSIFPNALNAGTMGPAAKQGQSLPSFITDEPYGASIRRRVPVDNRLQQLPDGRCDCGSVQVVGVRCTFPSRPAAESPSLISAQRHLHEVPKTQPYLDMDIGTRQSLRQYQGFV